MVEGVKEVGSIAKTNMKRIIPFLLIIPLLLSCRGPKVITDTHYVHDTTYVHKTEYVTKHDSTIREKETTIMQLDSAAMAAYGIRLENAEKAWLVKTRELERYLSELSHLKSDTVYVSHSDSSSVTDPIYIDKPLTKYQQHCISSFWPLVLALILCVAFLIYILIHKD